MTVKREQKVYDFPPSTDFTESHISQNSLQLVNLKRTKKNRSEDKTLYVRRYFLLLIPCYWQSVARNNLNKILLIEKR